MACEPDPARGGHARRSDVRLRLAERLADAAAGGGGFRARYARAEALRRQGRLPDAETQLALLADEARTDAERLRVAEARAVNLHWGLGRPADAEEVVRSAEAAVTDPGARDQLAALRSWLDLLSSRPAEAVRAVSPLLVREGIPPHVGVRVGLAAAPALARDEVPLAGHRLESARVLALALAGETPEAAGRAEAAYRTALAEGSHEGSALWTTVLGLLAIGRGQVETAVRWLTESASLLRELDPAGSLSWTPAALARANAQLGRAREAAAVLAKAEAAHRATQLFADFELPLARAWVSAVDGELPAARASALEAAAWAEAHGHVRFAVLGFPISRGSATRTWRRTGWRRSPRSWRGCSPRRVRSTRAPSSHGTAASSAVRRTSSNAAARSCAPPKPRPWPTALPDTRRAAGPPPPRHGRSQPAARARAPALARLGVGSDLTRREHEIALLAASGLSSPEIATRLVLSVRTIENYLQHAYWKLGVSTRDELARLLSRPTQPPPIRRSRD